MTISGPIAPYSNVPIQADFYQPRKYTISGITLGQTTLVTTSANHDYVIGQLIRLIVPRRYGTYQLNYKQGYIISLPAANQFTLDIPSYGYSAFVPVPAAVTGASITPQSLAIGDISSGQPATADVNSISTYIPGSFINIS